MHMNDSNMKENEGQWRKVPMHKGQVRHFSVERCTQPWLRLCIARGLLEGDAQRKPVFASGLDLHGVRSTVVEATQNPSVLGPRTSCILSDLVSWSVSHTPPE